MCLQESQLYISPPAVAPSSTACDLTCPMGQVNAECDACMCQDFVLHGAVSLPGGAPASGATVYLLTKTPKLLTKTDSSGRFRVPGLCPDGKSILKITKTKFAPIMLKMPKTSLKAATVNAEFRRAGIVLQGNGCSLGVGLDRKVGLLNKGIIVLRAGFPAYRVNSQILTMTHKALHHLASPLLLCSPLPLLSLPPPLSHSTAASIAS